MRNAYTVLALLVAAAVTCLAVLAWGIVARAEAAITAQVGSMFCAPIDELRAALKDYRPVMRGPSGSKSDRLGEIWMDAEGNWFAIQIVPDNSLYCIVMGGNPSLKLVDPAKEGNPT